MLPFSVAPEKAAAATKFWENTWCFNCYKYGHTWYNCIINCNLQDCPRTIPSHPAKCCSLRHCQNKPVGLPAVLNSKNLSEPLPIKPVVLSQKTYLDAALTTENIAAVLTPKARPLPSLPSATEPKQQATILAANYSPPAEVNPSIAAVHLKNQAAHIPIPLSDLSTAEVRQEQEQDPSTTEVHQEKKKSIPPKKAAAATACSI